VALLLAAAAGTAVVGAATRNYGAHPTQQQVVPMTVDGKLDPPPPVTEARAEAALTLNDAGTELAYRLYVANFQLPSAYSADTFKITEIHIHCAPPGKNGVKVVFLENRNPSNGFAPVPALAAGESFAPSAPRDGLLVEGTLTSANLLPWNSSHPLAGNCPVPVNNLADLVRNVDAGNAYVAIHTVAWPASRYTLIRGLIGAPTPAKMTGAGQIVPAGGGTANLGFVAQFTSGGVVSGSFNYVNYTTGLSLDGPVSVIYSIQPDLRTLSFNGTASNGCAFRVTVADNGAGTADRFTLITSCAGQQATQANNVPLTKGDIQWQPPA
jgi:hypothetical protein